MLIYISIASFSIAIIFIITLLVLNYSKEKSKGTFEKELLKRRKEATSKKNRTSKIYKQCHNLYLKVPGLKNLLQDLKQSLSMVGEKDQVYLIKKSVLIINGMLVVFIMLLILFYQVTNNLFYTAVFIIFLWHLSEGYIDYFITRSHNKLLEQQLRFISFVRQKYYEYGVVDDSIYEATTLMNIEDREMSVQGNLIYNMFLESDVEASIAEYLEIAPNAFLKMFVNFSKMTMEYGDQKKNGQSVYLMNLSFLSKNIQMEVDKRKRLNYALKSMNLIVMLPLFLISPLRNWSVSNFAPLGNFYNSPTGKITEIITIIIILFSMSMLNKISNIEKKSKGYNDIGKFLKKLKVPLKERYKKKWLFAIVVFIFSITVVLTVLYGAKFQLKSKVYYKDQFLGATLSKDEEALRIQESSIDYEFLRSSKATDGELEIGTYLETINESNEEASSFKNVVEGEFKDRENRLQEKVVLYHSYKLTWWEVLICLLISGFAYYIPEINKYIYLKMKALDIDDEVAGFRSIIMMLMYNPRMNVEEILEWLEAYAVYYKEQIHRCLLNLMSGEEEAILELMDTINNNEMKRLVHQLAMASEDISLEEAFDELIQEKANFFEQRKWQNEKLINRKILLGQNIGFLPAYSLIILYMIVPMVVTSSNELSRFFEQIM